MEDKKLELKLGLPGVENSTLSLNYMYSNKMISTTCGTKRGLVREVEDQRGERNWLVESNSTVNSTIPSSSEKRIALGPVVGWPPIRSFRKNLATSSSSKRASESPNEKPKDGNVRVVGDCLFVKINMDGVPIGRKVDLKVYNDYQKLFSVVDQLFRDLLAAQRDYSSMDLKIKKMEETKEISGVLDGNGEYTLVYEDNEGDRMLVGDVPWHMFVSTVKRLRVLKRSELSNLHINSIRLKKMPIGLQQK